MGRWKRGPCLEVIGARVAPNNDPLLGNSVVGRSVIEGICHSHLEAVRKGETTLAFATRIRTYDANQVQRVRVRWPLVAGPAGYHFDVLPNQTMVYVKSCYVRLKLSLMSVV